MYALFCTYYTYSHRPLKKNLQIRPENEVKFKSITCDQRTFQDIQYYSGSKKFLYSSAFLMHLAKVLLKITRFN